MDRRCGWLRFSPCSLLATLLLGGSVCSAAAGVAADADEAEDPAKQGPAPRWTLPEIVVTATRAPQDIQSIPSTAYRLGGLEAVASHGARTTPDVLRGLPSVMVQKTGYGQGSPYLRGFTGFRTLCLVDGIRLNNSVFRDGPNQYWSTVDPTSVSSYELVMGPCSVLYGSDAIGGVLNVVPIPPPAYQGSATWSGRLFYRGCTADDSHVARMQLGLRPTAACGLVVGIPIKRFADLTGGENVEQQAHTGYGEWDFDARVEYHLRANHTLTAEHQTVVQDDAWRTHRTIHGLTWEGLLRGDDKVHSYDQHRDLTYLRYSGNHLDSQVDRITMTISRHGQSEDLYRLKSDDRSERQGFDVATWGATLQLDADSVLGDWVFGAEFYRDGVDSYARKYRSDGSLEKVEIQGPVGDDASYDNLGVYLQDTIHLPAVDLIPGGRYTYCRARANAVKDAVSGQQTAVGGSWDALSGSLRALVPLRADRSYVLFTGIAQGFRAPNLSDLTRLDMARSGEIETPAPDLEPEQFVATEIGLKTKTSLLVSQIGYYCTFIDQMIVRTPTGETIDDSMEVTKKNTGRGYLNGVEISFSVHVHPQWTWWGAASWMNGKADAYPTSSTEQKRDYISRLMPPTAQAGLRWQAADGRVWSEAAGDWAGRADHLSADDMRDTQRIPPGGTPGYGICHVRVGGRVHKGIAMTLGLENIFNRDYRIHGSGVNEPGRNLVFTAEVEL